MLFYFPLAERNPLAKAHNGLEWSGTECRFFATLTNGKEKKNKIKAAKEKIAA